MRFKPPTSTHRYLWAGAVLLSCLSLAAFCLLGQHLVHRHRYTQRGVLHEPLAPSPLPARSLYGVNASLEQHASDEELRQALSLIRTAGFRWVRQHFPWAEIEPQPGEYRWEQWDRIVAEVKRQDLELIAVLDTSPVWARSPGDRENRFAPPQYVTTYGLFARAFAQRYGDHISCYEVWDQPNLSPHWGARAVDPAGYVRLLTVAAREVRQADGDAILLSAGLAPTTETGGDNLSDVMFLRGVYEAGGRGHFDVVAAKPYGFWSGPEDRRVDPQVLNFSRVIMLREEMVRHGDGHLPIWAVEFGWNALPQDWTGGPPPWGTDDLTKQADRTARAVQRARQEWAWLEVMCWSQLQPAVPMEDPSWGFALLTADLAPTPLYTAVQDAISSPVAVMAQDHSGYYLRLGLLLLGALCSGVLLVASWSSSAWPGWISRLADLYLDAPGWVQWALTGGVLGLYYFSPWPAGALLALALAGMLIYLRVDIGLSYAVFSIPFFLYPRSIFGKSFSTVEALVLLCCAAWCVRWLRQEILRSSTRSALANLQSWSSRWGRSLSSLDWAVLAFVLLAAISLLFSANLGVSIREFRVIIVEPAVLYFLLRQAGLRDKQLLRLPDALVLAGLAVSVFGLYQYFVSGDVIVTEGVRRIRGVYASPNNLSLLLGRIIPLGISGLLVAKPPRRHAYGAALVPLVLCLFLTYSRGGWLLSLPAGLLTIGLLRGRRATLLALAAIILSVALLLPIVGTERFLSLLQVGEGTTFFRLKLWQASLAMIRDHPITGVGLDNFLYRYPDYMLPEAWQEPGLSHPHNIVLDYWTRLGIGGIAALLWLQTAFFRQALGLYRRLPDGDQRAIILGLVASMVSALAHGLIDNSYFLVDLAFVFFLSFGIVRAFETSTLLPTAVSGAEIT